LLRLHFHDGAIDAATGDGGGPSRRAMPRVDQPKLL